MTRRRSAALALAAALVAETAGEGVRLVRADTPLPLLDVFTWGQNNAGQLGAIPPNSTVAGPIHEVRPWRALSAGTEFTVALTETGEVWTWGANASGQLGVGTRTPSYLPVRVEGLDGVSMVSAGAVHVLAYRASDQTLWGWGTNTSGQLARDPAGTPRSTRPTEITGLGPLRAVAAGGGHSAVLTEDGRVFAWGANAYGQLGNGGFEPTFAPAAVELPAGATAVAAGAFHTVAVLEPTGAVWAWGWNVYGQLGRGVQGAFDGGEPLPAPASALAGIVEVACGDLHTLARASDGGVWAFGYNTEGQVGNGDNTPAHTGLLAPVRVKDLTEVAHIDAGATQSMALRTNGEVWTWGNNRFGNCGDNDYVDRKVPVRALGLSNVVAIAMSDSHAAAVAPARRSSGVTAVGWTGSAPAAPTERPALAPAAGLGDIVRAAAGYRHALVVDGEHRVWGWGDNSRGQVQPSGPPSIDAPAPIDLPLGAARGFVQVAARGNHSFALRSDGAVFTWGDNQYGQLGTGNTDAQGTFVQMTLDTVTGIAAGERHGLALRSGRVWAWGRNDNAQRGQPVSAAPPLAPAALDAFYTASAVSAGAFHSLALGSFGQLYVWGSGYRGQIGDDRFRDSDRPVQVGIEHVTAFSAGRFHTLVVQAGGDVWAFGDDETCQRGIRAPDGSAPLRVRGVPPALAVVAGDYHGGALTDAGQLWAWGDDSGGQLGRSDSTWTHSDCEPSPIGEGSVTVAAGGLSSTVIATE